MTITIGTLVSGTLQDHQKDWSDTYSNLIIGVVTRKNYHKGTNNFVVRVIYPAHVKNKRLEFKEKDLTRLIQTNQDEESIQEKAFELIIRLMNQNASLRTQIKGSR